VKTADLLFKGVQLNSLSKFGIIVIESFQAALAEQQKAKAKIISVQNQPRVPNEPS
jgi:hypothetical protein